MCPPKIFFYKSRSVENVTFQWRIQDVPGTVRQPIIWQDFCRKLLENERNWTEMGGECVPSAPLKSWLHVDSKILHENSSSLKSLCLIWLPFLECLFTIEYVPALWRKHRNRSYGVFTLTETKTDNWQSKIPKLWAKMVSFKQKTGSFTLLLILITTDRNMTFYFTIENINRTHLIP